MLRVVLFAILAVGNALRVQPVVQSRRELLTKALAVAPLAVAAAPALAEISVADAVNKSPRNGPAVRAR